jgi:5'-3' exoribonuclease 1
MVDLSAVCGRITFEIGQPFFPFQQLLGCLPPASRTMLPRAYQWLMVNPESPVLEFYPLDFGIDMDGKRNPWEAVVLLDFIDEKRLLKAESEFCSPDLLSSDERSRNSFGNVLTHNFDPNVTETYFSCNPEIGLLDVTNCQSVVTQTYPKLSPGAFFRPELIPGTIFPLAGFPSLITLPIENVETDFFKMNTFGSESKYRSISLELAESVVDASTLDPKVLVGRVVFVNYPQIHEAKVVAVTTANEEYRSVTRVTNGGTKTEVVCTPHDVATAKKWQVDADAEQQKYFKGRGTPGSGGMIIGDIKIRLRGQSPFLFFVNSTKSAVSARLFGPIFNESHSLLSTSCKLYLAVSNISPSPTLPSIFSSA